MNRKRQVFFALFAIGNQLSRGRLPDALVAHVVHLIEIRESYMFWVMTQAVAQILGEVERLSEAERRELRHAIIERIPVSEDLTDEDFGALAAASFRTLDEEEA